jgi:hypothetical protein
LRRIPEQELKAYVDETEEVDHDFEENKLQDVKIKPSIQDIEK